MDKAVEHINVELGIAWSRMQMEKAIKKYGTHLSQSEMEEEYDGCLESEGEVEIDGELFEPGAVLKAMDRQLYSEKLEDFKKSRVEDLDWVEADGDYYTFHDAMDAVKRAKNIEARETFKVKLVGEDGRVVWEAEIAGDKEKFSGKVDWDSEFIAPIDTNASKDALVNKINALVLHHWKYWE